MHSMGGMSSMSQPVVHELVEDGVVAMGQHHDVQHWNNLLPSTPLMSKPFLFESTPEVVAKYDASKLDTRKTQKSLKSHSSKPAHHKITDFQLYKSNIICSVGKGIGYAKLKTPSQVMREPVTSSFSNFSQSQHQPFGSEKNFAATFNSKMVNELGSQLCDEIS